MFCDSGYVILNSLKETLAKRLKVSSIAMSVALATGLYATHNFVPPTPGPIAAAGNLGLADNLGLVIVMGLVVSVPACLAGWLWANRFVHEQPQGEGAAGQVSTAGSVNAADREASSPADAVAATRYADADDTDGSADQTRHAQMPSPLMAFMPIVLPIALICIGSVAAFPSRPLGSGLLFTAAAFLGKPLCALLIGFLFSLLLIRGEDRAERISALITQGLVLAAPILLITGAGGAFGAVIKETPVGSYLGHTLSSVGLGVFMPFVVAAALKTAQGSSTVSLVTTSTLVAPLMASIGLDSEMGRLLCVMAIGAGAMTVSHANDSYFWVVTQFSRMSVAQALRAQTAATAMQGIVAILFIWLLSLVVL